MILRNQTVTFFIKRDRMSNTYLSPHELIEAIDELTPAELKLYGVLKMSVRLNQNTEDFSDESLSKIIGVKPSVMPKLRSSLKRKGYALIKKHKDNDGDTRIDIVAGKEQMALYTYGIKCQIGNSKAWKRLLEKYPLLNPEISKTSRNRMVKEINKEFEENRYLYE